MATNSGLIVAKHRFIVAFRSISFTGFCVELLDPLRLRLLAFGPILALGEAPPFKATSLDRRKSKGSLSKNVDCCHQPSGSLI